MVSEDACYMMAGYVSEDMCDEDWDFLSEPNSPASVGGAELFSGESLIQQGTMAGQQFQHAAAFPDYVSEVMSKKIPEYIKPFIHWYSRNFYKEYCEIRKKIAETKGPLSSGVSKCPAPGCYDWSKKGTNAYVEVWTCKTCGYQVKGKKKPSADPSVCTHEKTDHVGSNKAVKVTRCSLCHKIVDTRTIQEHQKLEEARASLLPATEAQLDVIKEVMVEYIITRDEMARVDVQYRGMLEAHFNSSNTIASTECQKLLGLAIEEVCTPLPKRPGRVPTVNTAAASQDKGKGKGKPPVQVNPKYGISAEPHAKLKSRDRQSAALFGTDTRVPARTFKSAQAKRVKQLQKVLHFHKTSGPDSATTAKRQNTSGFKNLPEIDEEDPNHVLAVPDTGCNNNCHGRKWRERAEALLSKLNEGPMVGRKPTWVSSETREFKGIGGKSTTYGEYNFPGHIRGMEKDGVAPIDIQSHEQDGSHHVLMSWEFMGRLGLVIDTAAGTIYCQAIKDFIPCYRMRKTGLVCIDVFNIPNYPNELLKECQSYAMMCVQKCRTNKHPYCHSEMRDGVEVLVNDEGCEWPVPSEFVDSKFDIPSESAHADEDTDYRTSTPEFFSRCFMNTDRIVMCMSRHSPGPTKVIKTVNIVGFRG